MLVIVIKWNECYLREEKGIVAVDKEGIFGNILEFQE